MEFAYFEDIEIGEKKVWGDYFVDKNEMVEFAKKWDPQPLHVDEQVAKSYPSGGLTASSNYTMCIVTLLGATQEKRAASLGVLEYERFKIFSPVRPSDLLTVTVERIDKRESKTKPDRGIVHTLVEVRNQHNELNLSYVATVMVAKRPQQSVSLA